MRAVHAARGPISMIFSQPSRLREVKAEHADKALMSITWLKPRFNDVRLWHARSALMFTTVDELKSSSRSATHALSGRNVLMVA